MVNASGTCRSSDPYGDLYFLDCDVYNTFIMLTVQQLTQPSPFCNGHISSPYGSITNAYCSFHSSRYRLRAATWTLSHPCHSSTDQRAYSEIWPSWQPIHPSTWSRPRTISDK